MRGEERRPPGRSETKERMDNATQFKRWKISEVLLKRAHRALPRPAREQREQFAALETEFEEYLEHNEHELALDTLQELGELVSPRGGFWKDLMRAAENMELLQRLPYFEKKFNEALSRLSSK
jgi:hypothetical protein